MGLGTRHSSAVTSALSVTLPFQPGLSDLNRKGSKADAMGPRELGRIFLQHPDCLGPYSTFLIRIQFLGEE